MKRQKLNIYGKAEMINLISVDEYSITPKYLQIVNSVKREIESGNILKGEKMPSINELSIKLDIARDTVERGYRFLKNRYNQSCSKKRLLHKKH